MRCPPAAVVLPVLLSPLAGQREATAPKDVPMVLAPGAVDLRAVVRQAARYLGQEVEIDPAFGATPLKLQNPIRLGRGSCLSVVSRIAKALGLVLVPAEDKLKWVAATGTYRSKVLAEPCALTPRQVLDPDHPGVVVRTTLEVADAGRLALTIRAYFSFSDDPPRIEARDGKRIDIGGWRAAVADVVRVMAAVDSGQLDPAGDGPIVAALTTAPRAAGASYRLGKGTHPLAFVLDKVAQVHGTNHLYVEREVRGREVQVDESVELTPARALVVASELGARCGIAMVPLAADHGIFCWIPVRGPRAHEVTSLLVSPDGVKALGPLRVGVTTLFKPEKTTVRQAIMSLRGRVEKTVSYTSFGDSLVLMGPAPHVGAALKALGR